MKARVFRGGTPNMVYHITKSDLYGGYSIVAHITGETAFYPNGTGPFLVGKGLSIEEVDRFLVDLGGKTRLYDGKPVTSLQDLLPIKTKSG